MMSLRCFIYLVPSWQSGSAADTSKALQISSDCKKAAARSKSNPLLLEWSQVVSQNERQHELFILVPLKPTGPHEYQERKNQKGRLQLVSTTNKMQNFSKMCFRDKLYWWIGLLCVCQGVDKHSWLTHKLTQILRHSAHFFIRKKCVGSLQSKLNHSLRACEWCDYLCHSIHWGWNQNTVQPTKNPDWFHSAI